MNVRYDKPTKKFMMEHPTAQITVIQCEKCGLFYRASFVHECQKKEVGKP